MGMQDSFRKWPQGVPVRRSSPTDPSSFSAFVPAPTSTQNVQRKRSPVGNLSSASWWFDPLYGREEAGSRTGWKGSPVTGVLGEFTTSPFDLALLGLAAFPLTSWAGIPALGLRVASKLPAAIRMSRAAHAAATGGKALATPARLAGKILDPAAGTAAALPSRLLVETGLNIGAGAGVEYGGEVGGVPGAIIGGLAGGIGGAYGTSKGVKGLRKGYEKILKLPSTEDHVKNQDIALFNKNKKIAEIQEDPKLKHYVGQDPKDPDKFDIDGYLLDTDLKHLKSKQEAFAKWADMMKNKVHPSVRAVISKGQNIPGYSRFSKVVTDPQNLGENIISTAMNPHRLFDPAIYARGKPQQAAHVAEMHKYRQSLLIDRMDKYIRSPLKSGRHFYDDSVLGNVEESATTLQGIRKRLRKGNPRYGRITGGPLTEPSNMTKINNALKKAGIKDNTGKVKKLTFTEEGGLNISEQELAEMYLSPGSKEGAVWRSLDESIMTADIKEHIGRLKEIYQFRRELLKRARGRNNKKIDMKYIYEGDDAIIPFASGDPTEIDAVIKDAIDNTDPNTFQGMTKKQVKDLVTSKGQFYMGRHVVHKVDPDTGEILQGMELGGSFYKITRGTKGGFEKQREFQWISEGMDEGWVYQPAHVSAIHNIQSVMKRINDVEMARILESEYKEAYNLRRDKTIAKLYGKDDVEQITEKVVLDTWNPKKQGKPTQEAVNQEVKLVSALVDKKQWRAMLDKDKELKKASEDLPKDYDKANKIILASMDLLGKIRKNPKTFKRIKSEVEELTKLRRFFPEIDDILGENLILRTNKGLDKLIKELRKDVKSEYNMKDYHLKFAVKLQQARRVFGLKSKIDQIPTDRRTRAYKEWVESDDGKYFEGIAKEFQNDFAQYVKSQEDIVRDIAKAQGKPIPARTKIKSSDMSADIKNLFDSPEDYVGVKQAFDKMAQTGFTNITKSEVEKAIKILDAQMRVRRGAKTINITEDDWRRASAFLNKSVYRKNIASITHHFENYVNLENIDVAALTKRLEDNVDDLISKTKAYNERYKILIKKQADRNKFLEISTRSPLFKNLYVNAKQSDQRARDQLANSIRKIEEIYKPPALLKYAEELNAVQRLAALALDASLGGIQLATVLGNHSPVYLKAMGKFIQQTSRALTNPQAAKQAKIDMYTQADNVEIRSRSGIILSGDPRQGNMNLEFQQALEKNRLLDRFGRWVETRPYGMGVAGGAVKAPIGRVFGGFGDSFAFAMDYAGLEIRKGLDPIATDAKTAAALDKYVDSIRGLSSSQASGVLASQRFKEAMTLLAPRYRRAMFTLYGLSLQKGPVGSLARRGIVNTVGGFMMLATAFTLAQSGYNEDSPEETRAKVSKVLDPTDSDYMLVDYGGQKVGIGGKLVSDAKFIAKVISLNKQQILSDEERQDYESFTNFNFQENPGFKWIRSQLAAAPGEAWNLLAGENYMGERYWNKEDDMEGKIFTGARQMSENVFPLWLQSMLYDTDWGNMGSDEFIGMGTRVTSDFLGLRSWPENPGNLLHKESWDMIGKSYSDLEPYEKKILTHKLREKLNRWQRQQIERSDNEITHYFHDKKEIDIEFYQGVRALMDKYPDTKQGNRDLMYRYNKLKDYRKGRLYEKGLDMEDEWPNRDSDNPILQALNEASNIFDIEGVQEAVGVYDWDLYEDELNKLKAKSTPEQVAAIDRNQRDMPYPMEFLRRMQRSNPKEYQRIMQSQALREQELIKRGDPELIEISRRRFFMLDEEGNLDIELE